MDTIKNINDQQSLELKNEGMSSPIETSPEISFENLPLESIRHGFLRRNNFYLRRGVPESHRRVADNFMIIKKVFGHPVVQPKITQEEANLLARYDFNLLEYSTAKQIEDEIVYLKKWSYSTSRELQYDAENIIKIRAKELKYMIATNYVNISNNVYNGHEVLSKYFEEISKYYSDQ